MGMAKLGITDWATVDLLAPALKIATTVRILDLSCNKIGRDGGVAIFKALHNNTSLKSLKLGCCSILDEGAEAAGEMLSYNRDLQKYC
jgi:Ran GTPase-activating protein (RanGAP) involved in mRNA processing and transport